LVIIRTNENVITIKQPIWNKIYQKKTRTESDLIGSREVPESALYGVQTLRGIENFRISKFHLNEYPLFIQALAITKMGATIANRELDLLT
jgi:aspA: aspartate ammonia-lyase